jgi:UDP-glucose 4-epimerase
MSKIVVFGGNGFIGRHLVTRLASGNPQASVYVFDRFSSYEEGKDAPFSKYPNITIIPGDFFNRDAVNSVLLGADYVFHLISTTNPATSESDPFIDIDTNIRSSIELFELCVENKIKKVIFFSSGGAVYGNIDSDTINEETSPQPLSPYAIGKLTIEHYLRYFKRTHGLDYVIYRIANPYGPGQNIYGKQGVIPIFMHKYAMKEPITIYGDGLMKRDYIYINDLANMIVGSYDKKNEHEIYNIGSGKGTSINELVSTIEKHTNYIVKKTYVDAPSTYIENSVLDTRRFNDEFSLEPTIGLEEGIKRTWDYVKTLK